MLFTISGKHIEITEAIKKHAEEKTSRLPKYYNSINQVEVIIDAGPGDNTSVEIIVRAEHSNTFVVTEVCEDAYKGIDVAVHKLERQLKKKKEKQRDNKHTGGESQNVGE